MHETGRLLLAMTQVLLVIAPAACGDDGAAHWMPPVDREAAEDLCTTRLECPGIAMRPNANLESCVAVLAASMVSDACIEAFEAATCADHEASPATYIDLCTPPCAEMRRECVSETELELCEVDEGALRYLRMDCVRACDIAGLPFVRCGAGQDGKLRCLCGVPETAP